MSRWAAAALILFLFTASVLFIQKTGTSSRKYHKPFTGFENGIPIHLVNSTNQVYRIWKDSGIKGRVALHFGRFLHFVPIEDEDIFRGKDHAPTLNPDILSEYESRLNVKNFLLIAMEGNVAREIYNVVPAAVMKEKLMGIEDGSHVVNNDIITHYYGSRRTISERIPSFKEPVVINIDASYFSSAESARLIEEIRKSGIRSDMVTLCLSEDNDDVTEEERERLKEFSASLSGI